VFFSPAAFARDPASWMRVASEYRATMTQGPDFAYRLCAMRFGKQSERNLKGFRTNEELLLNLSKLRSCLNASERAQHDTHFLFASTFASHGWNPKSMRAGYGLAESVVYVCDGPVRVAQINRRALEETNEAVECAPFDVRAKALDDDDDDASSFSSVRVSSCGAVRVVSGDGDALDALDPDVRVVCPETHKELPDGRVGEIWVRGGSVAFGYVDEDGFSLGAAFGVPLATGKIWEKKKKGGYLRTGDVGFIDGVSGEVFVVGRMRDRFKVNGRAYSPEDIERVILDAKPGVFRRGGVAAFAFEEDALREKKQKKTIAFCTPATRVGVVAEVRDECLVHDPVAYARLLDDVREVVSVTHGLRLRRRDVALVRKGAAPKTSSGKKRRDETRKLFLDGYFFKKGVAVEGFSSTLFTQDNDFFAEEHRFGSMFLLDDTGLGEKTAREESSTELCAKTFLRRLAKKRGARFAARHVETCLRRFFATERFFVNPGSSVDSFAAVRLTARLEFELGVSIPPTLVLLNAAKPEKLARALLRAAVSDEDTEEDQHQDAAPDAASDTFFSVSPEERVRLSSSLDGTDGTDAATKKTVFGDRPIVRAIPLILLTLALLTRRESDGHSRVAFSLNRADEKEMAAHARFFEWRVWVAPAQIAIGVVVWVLTRTVRRFFFLVCGTCDDADENDKQRDVDARLLAFFSASANAFLTHGALGLCFVYAHVGVRFLCEKTLAKVSNTKNTLCRETSSSPSRKTRVAIAWGLCLAELFLLNASEAWTARDSFTKWQKRKRHDGKEASLLSVFLKRGALAGSTFTPTRAARYVAIRSLDRSLDRIEEGFDTNADAFVDAFAFAAQTATFQCGPLVPHATYAEKSRESVSKKRKKRKKKKLGVSFGYIFLTRLTRLLDSLVPLVSWCLLVDLMYVVGYRPTTTFFARDVTVNGVNDARLSACGFCGFSSFAQTIFFATASWITSHAVFGVPRAVAIAFDDTVGLGDDAFLHTGDDDDDDDDDDASTLRSTTAHVVPHDTPCFWPSAAKTPATFWRCFHASFFTFYFARCFAPLNGGYGGIVVAVAVSTAFHGFQTKWLMWGAITAFGLVAEKYVNGRFRVRERRREEKKTSSPRFASQTIETIRAAVVQTATVATFVGPATFPGLGLRTAAKVLTWGILISAAWQNAERGQRVAREARA
jgi:acyl-CoA synthetase (AMP-forming)/AMP-acid ligase II